MQFQRDQQQITLIENDQLKAAATFPIIDSQTWAVEHIWVANGYPDRQALARQLIDHVVELAQAEHVKLLPLDPYARQYLQHNKPTLIR